MSFLESSASFIAETPPAAETQATTGRKPPDPEGSTPFGSRWRSKPFVKDVQRKNKVVVSESSDDEDEDDAAAAAGIISEVTTTHNYKLIHSYPSQFQIFSREELSSLDYLFQLCH